MDVYLTILLQTIHDRQPRSIIPATCIATSGDQYCNMQQLFVHALNHRNYELHPCHSTEVDSAPRASRHVVRQISSVKSLRGERESVIDLTCTCGTRLTGRTQSGLCLPRVALAPSVEGPLRVALKAGPTGGNPFITALVDGRRVPSRTQVP